MKKSLDISPGDTILLLGDGFIERFNRKREIFDDHRVRQVFKEVAHKPPGKIIEHLAESGDRWADGRPQDDDITFVVLKVT